MKAALLAHTSPWIMAGRPETAACYWWARWILDLTGAENWAERQRLESRSAQQPGLWTPGSPGR